MRVFSPAPAGVERQLLPPETTVRAEANHVGIASLQQGSPIMNLSNFDPPRQVVHSVKQPDFQAPSLHLAHSIKPVVPRDKLIDLQAVCQIVGVKKSTVYTWLGNKESDFPRPVRLSARMVRWSESAVLQWVQRCLNGAASVETSPS